MTVPSVVIVHAVQIRLTQKYLAVPRSGKKKKTKNLFHVFLLMLLTF